MDYIKMSEVLEPLGFEHIGGGKFLHKITIREFDFSASSIDGVPHWIYEKGVKDGIEKTKRNFRIMIGIT